MATVIRIVNEQRRGCGFRKEGGLYLVAGIPEGDCGKLPLKLEVCPTCHQGIKPARAWTWVDAEKLFGNVLCREAMRTVDVPVCVSCPLGKGWLKAHPRMGLLWIGEAHYPTPEDFLAEGMAQGLSRRITAIPKTFEIGKTYVLLAHRRTVPCKECSATGKVDIGHIIGDVEIGHAQESCDHCKGRGWLPGIFGCFRPTRIEYIIKDDDTEEKLDRLEERGITLIKLLRDDVQAEMELAASQG